MNKPLIGYIEVIGNGLIIPIDDYVAPADDKLIYKLICSFSIPDKTSVSNKFVKKLINKVRVQHQEIYDKTQYHRYEVVQTYNKNKLLILEYYKGELKERFEGTEL